MKIFLCEPIHEKAYEFLKQQAEIIDDYSKISEVDAIINRNLHIDGELMSQCPHLKVIGIHGTGKDGVDLEKAGQLGIKVVYVPYENADSVAELIVALTLAAARNIVLADRMIQNGEKLSSGSALLMGMELKGKTFGMVGCGDIAMRAGRRLKNGLGMRLIGYSPSLTDEKAAELGIERCAAIEEVFENADVINIGVHLTPQTEGMIDMNVMRHARPGAILINTARGAVIREQDLYKALKQNIISAAACDVFEQEPPTRENPLLSLPNFIGTPHIGATTEEALYRVGMSVVTQVMDVLEGRQALHEYH